MNLDYSITIFANSFGGRNTLIDGPDVAILRQLHTEHRASYGFARVLME
jgi:hypothetical protein